MQLTTTTPENFRRIAARCDKRKTIAVAFGFAALIAGRMAGSAAGLDRSVLGASTASPQDCNKLFERRGGAIVYRQPVDKFAQAAIIEPGQIVTPSSVCGVHSVTGDNGETKVSSDCQDWISFTQTTAYIKTSSDGHMIYSPTGDPRLPRP